MKTMTTTPWLLSFVYVMLVSGLQPPLLPAAFSVSFIENFNIKGLKMQNNGSWAYNFQLNSMVYDKFHGQIDVWCHLSNLHPEDRSAHCRLLFANDKQFYIFYPEVKRCCMQCEKDQHCTALKQTWLSNSSYIGDLHFNGTICHGWQIKGASTTDTWYVTDKGVPCQLHTKSFRSDIAHNMTFNQNSFINNPPLDPTLFAVPSYCKEKCPIPFPG